MRNTGWVVALAVAAAACGGGDGTDTAGGDCEPGALPTVTDGTLTIGTDTPAFPPWFVDDDPTNGEGFESAVAYAVAEELGYADDAVEWIVDALQQRSSPPARRTSTSRINQVSINEERDEAVDFCDGLLRRQPGDRRLRGLPGDRRHHRRGPARAALGAQVGTTSLDFITERHPARPPSRSSTTTTARPRPPSTPSRSTRIVLDLPTAFFVSAVEIEGTAVIGQFPAADGGPEQFGMVFEEGSPLQRLRQRGAGGTARRRPAGRDRAGVAVRCRRRPRHRHRLADQRDRAAAGRAAPAAARAPSGAGAAPPWPPSARSSIVGAGGVAGRATPRAGPTCAQASSRARPFWSRCPTSSRPSGSTCGSSCWPRSLILVLALLLALARSAAQPAAVPGARGLRRSTSTCCAASRCCWSCSCWASACRRCASPGVPNDPVLWATRRAGADLLRLRVGGLPGRHRRGPRDPARGCPRRSA